MSLHSIAVEKWQSYELLQSTLDAIEDPVFVKDLQHRWIVLNTAFSKMLGKPSDWLRGKSDPDLFPPDQAEAFWRGDDEVFNSARPNVNEEQLAHADGTHHTIWTRKFPMRDAQGSVVGLCGIITDVTALTERQDEIRRLEKELGDKSRVIVAQQAALQSLAVPVIQVWHQVLLLPLVGVMDNRRAVSITETLLQAVTRMRARFVLIDITGVPMVDTDVAAQLLRTAEATRLLGCRAILVGISPLIAQTIMSLGIDFGSILTRATLQDGLEHVFEQLGYAVDASASGVS